jgi:hypothetical protein
MMQDKYNIDEAERTPKGNLFWRRPNGIIEMQLTQGKYCIFDEEDLNILQQYKWYAIKNKNRFYAQSKVMKSLNRRIRLYMSTLLLNHVKYQIKARNIFLDCDSLNYRRNNLNSSIDLNNYIQNNFWSKVERNGPIPQTHPHLGPCWIWTASLNNNGYGQIRSPTQKTMIAAHRLSYELNIGKIPIGFEIDHICHNKICINPSHLRLATHSQNGQYQKWNKRNTSGSKGVSRHRNKWRARIKNNGKEIYLGTYNNIEEAKIAYDKAAKEFFGDFAHIGYHARI